MTGFARHKDNDAITTQDLRLNKIGVEGAIALAGALEAAFGMRFSRCARHVLVPSQAQSLDYNHLSTLEQKMSILIECEVRLFFT